MPDDIPVTLRAGMRPGDGPINFQMLRPDAFRKLFTNDTSDYREVNGPSGAVRFAITGVYTAGHKTYGNQVFVRLALLDGDDNERAHIDLSAASCVAIAQHLLGFSVAAANVNGTPEAVGTALVGLFESFLSPTTFRQVSEAIADATAEIVTARLLLEHDRIAKRG